MKKIFPYLFISAFILVWNSCDKVAFPKQKTTTTSTGNNTVVRKVLLEDYTGNQCGNCPPAALIAAGLESQYGNKVIELTVHAGQLSVPGAPPFDYNFQTTVGTDYLNTFGIASWPTGLVNRVDTFSGAGGMLLTYSTWASYVGRIINLPPDANISITNIYDPVSRHLNVSVKSKFLTANTNNVTYKLAVLFVEDSVQKPQKDDNYSPTFVQSNYVHHHVLRGAINGSGTGWGDPLITNLPVHVNDSITLTCPQFTVPNNYDYNSSLWSVDDHKCSVIAFIYDADPLSPTHYQIIQVEEKEIR